MRIAFLTPEFVTESYFAGGLAQYLGRLVPALVARGHSTEVFVTSRNECGFDYHGAFIWRVPPEPCLLLRVINGLRRTVGHPPLAWTQRVYSVARGLDRSVRRHHAASHFDIIQAASWMATGFFAVRKPAAPVVVRASSYSPLYDVSAGFALTADRRAVWELELTMMRRAAAVYAPSRFLAHQISSQTGLHVDTIPPPFCLGAVTEDSSVADGLSAISPYLLFFGRISPSKGVDLLLEAVKPLLHDLPDFHVVAAGPKGGDDLLALLTSLERAFPDRVRYLGILPPEQLRPVVRRARGVVLPSVMDNLPNACLEAMGLGQVVTGPNGLSFDELITDGESGILFEPGNALSLQRAIVRGWRMPGETRARIGQAAKARIAALEPHRVLPELESFYEHVIQKNAHTPRR